MRLSRLPLADPLMRIEDSVPEIGLKLVSVFGRFALCAWPSFLDFAHDAI